MIELGQCEITAVFGPMASGKTYLIEEWLKDQNRYVRFDATGESIDTPGVEHVWQSPKALYDRIKSNPYYFRVCYHPGEDIQQDFYYCTRVLWRFHVYKLLVCDEFHEVCSVSETPQFVQTAMRYARHNHLAIIGASQRIADVHKLFTSGSRKTVIFWTQEARDLGAVRERWGSAAENMVANLRPLLYNDRSKEVRQIPQCLVIEKGSKPRVYDFQTKSFLKDSNDSAESETPQEEINLEGGAGERFSHSRSNSEPIQLSRNSDSGQEPDGNPEAG